MARVSSKRVKRAKLVGASVTIPGKAIVQKGFVITPDHAYWEAVQERYGFEDDPKKIDRNTPWLVLEAEPTAAEKKKAKGD